MLELTFESLYWLDGMNLNRLCAGDSSYASMVIEYENSVVSEVCLLCKL